MSGNPWDAPPILAVGDENADAIYLSVGRALSHWEILEGLLAILFERLVNAETNGASRAYGTVVAFSGRSSMLLEAFLEFPGSTLDEFKALKPLLAEVGLFAPRRNEIAHGAVMQVGTLSGHTGLYLCPAFYSSAKRHSPRMAGIKGIRSIVMGKYAYTSAQIDVLTGHFERLYRLLSPFVAQTYEFWEAFHASDSLDASSSADSSEPEK